SRNYLICKQDVSGMSWIRHVPCARYAWSREPRSTPTAMASGNLTRSRTTVRTLFLSDIHLGYRHARARELNEFLAGIHAENIVLVGDIVDALSLARRPYWSSDHTQVVRTLLARQRAGSRLVYIPGNHDASLAMLAQ